MNSLTVLLDNPLWLIICAVVGLLVCACVGVFVLYLAYHILRGFVFACSFMRWTYRVAKINGRNPKWRGFTSAFLSSWFRYTGYSNNGRETVSQGRSYWRGLGDNVAFDENASRFVDDAPKYTAKSLAKSLAKPKAKRTRLPQHKPRPALVPLHELQTEENVQDDVGDYFHKMANDAADEDSRGHDFDALEINSQLDEEDAELQKMTAGGPRITPRVQKQAKRKRRK